MKRGNPPSRLAAQRNVVTRILTERDRQIQKWGDDSYPKETNMPILTEEVGEVARAINDEESDAQLLDELVQVAAVALRWAEDLMLEMDR